MPPEPGQLKAIGLVSKVYSLSNVVALKQCIYKITKTPFNISKSKIVKMRFNYSVDPRTKNIVNGSLDNF